MLFSPSLRSLFDIIWISEGRGDFLNSESSTKRPMGDGRERVAKLEQRL
jgi:hypothetical protein